MQELFYVVFNFSSTSRTSDIRKLPVLGCCCYYYYGATLLNLPKYKGQGYFPDPSTEKLGFNL